MPIIWIIILAIILTLTIFWHRERYCIEVRNYTVEVNNLPEAYRGFKILHLSDIHSKRFGKEQEVLLRTIHSQPFDLVALTGDLIGWLKKDITPAIELINGLKTKPIYFVPGNHEWEQNFIYKKSLVNIGVKVLENKSEKILKNEECLWIIGVDDPHEGRDRLDKVIAEITEEASPKILLAHSPNIFPKAIDYKVDLVLTGHTHGGQVRLPFIGAVVAPGQGFFPKWDYGCFKERLTTMIINSGLGESDLPIRLNIKPEIVYITLLPKQ